MNRCKRCVMPDSRPDHVFVDGLCPACVNYKTKHDIDWEERKRSLHRLLDAHNGEVLVPSSGQKDSTYQCLALREMGAHVTALTVRTCHLTDMGRKNIDNLAKYVRTVEFTPDMTVRAKLNRLGLELVGDISLPEHMAIFTTPFRMAIELENPLIMYGENSQMEYGGPVGTEAASQLTKRWRSELGGFCGMRPSDFIGIEGITRQDMDDYEIPTSEALEDSRIKAYFLGHFVCWDSHVNAKVAKEHGMLQQKPCDANWWEHENLDNAQTGLHDYFMYLKYGYGRGCNQISIDVRNGVVSRDFALDWVNENDGKYPDRYMDIPIADILGNVGITMKDFHAIEESFRCWQNE